MQQLALDDQALVRRVLQLLEEVGRGDRIAEHVDLTALEPKERHLRLLPDLEDDRVEIGHAVAEVVLVALEHDALAERPLGHLVGAGAHRVAAEVLAELLHRLLRDGEAEVDGHDVQEVRVGLAELEHHGAIVGRGDAGQLVRLAGDHLVESRDLPEEALAGALCLGIDGTLDGVLDVGGHQFAAVVERHAVAQHEGVGELVVRDRVALGEVRDQLGGARLVVHQPVEQGFDHRPVLPVVADRRIERGDVVLVGDDHLPALLARLLARLRGLRGRRRGERRHGHRHRHHRHGKRSQHVRSP